MNLQNTILSEMDRVKVKMQLIEDEYRFLETFNKLYSEGKYIDMYLLIKTQLYVDQIMYKELLDQIQKSKITYDECERLINTLVKTITLCNIKYDSYAVWDVMVFHRFIVTRLSNGYDDKIKQMIEQYNMIIPQLASLQEDQKVTKPWKAQPIYLHP